MSLCQCCSSMSCVPGVLLPHLSGVVVTGAREEEGRVVLTARPAAGEAACPRCGTLSGARHGSYWRRLRDAPAGGRDVVIWLEAVRYRCLSQACQAVTFTGQVSGLASRFARRTPVLAAMLAAIAAVLCGRPGARLAAALGTAAPSRHSMIRLLMAVPVAEAAVPATLGIDDFALRKGHVYGTVLVDVVTGQVVDLLADRESGTLKAWLEAHPGATVICRDRAGAYADGAAGGAPGAIQVADRWHLWHNLCEKAYEAAVAHRASCLGTACGAQQPGPGQPGPGQPGPAAARLPGRGRPRAARPAAEAPGPGKRGEPWLPERTRQRHAAVHQLLAARYSRTEIARTLGLSLPTVRRYATAATAAEVTPAARESALDPYKPYLITRWNAGVRDVPALHAEITAQGYAGSAQPVWRFTSPLRDLPPGTAPEPPPAVPSARSITRWLTTRPGDLADDDKAALAAATTACPHLTVLHGLIRDFAAMISDLDGATAGPGGTTRLDAWLAAAAASGLPPLATLANGIRKDHDAVLNGLSLPWSSGKVEGTVNKIKMIKRQGYGRASFPLLRKRVLLA